MMKSTIAVGIGSVERETGISKETLRIWERRYGFPHPVRTSNGVRNYSDESIAKLRLVKRLLDRGLRAGDIVPKSIEQLEAIDRSTTTSRTGTDRALLPSFRAQDIDQFRLWLRERVLTLSVETFIFDVVRPLCAEIGIAWQRNEIGVFEEQCCRSKSPRRCVTSSLGSPIPACSLEFCSRPCLGKGTVSDF